MDRMGITDRAKELADSALLKAGELSERAAGRAAELSVVAREKAPGYVDRAADLTVKAVDVTAGRVDQVTGGRFHDKLEDATAKVGQSLDRSRSDQPAEPPRPTVVDPDAGAGPDVTGQAGEPTAPTATNPEAAKPEGPKPTP
jgi:hypothetical protein